MRLDQQRPGGLKLQNLQCWGSVSCCTHSRGFLLRRVCQILAAAYNKKDCFIPILLSTCFPPSVTQSDQISSCISTQFWIAPSLASSEKKKKKIWQIFNNDLLNTWEGRQRRNKQTGPGAAHGVKMAGSWFVSQGWSLLAQGEDPRERPGSECKQARVYRAEICTASALPQLLLTWDMLGKAGENNLLHPQQLQNSGKKAGTGKQRAAPGAITQLWQ